MKKKDDNKKPACNEHTVGEPAVPYRSSLKIFHSVEDFENENLAQMAGLLPEENLKNTVELILKTFGLSRDQLKNGKVRNKITIISG